MTRNDRQVPAGWQVVRLGDVAEVNPRRPKLNVGAQTPITFIPMAAVAENCTGIILREQRPYSEIASGYTYFQEDDVLFAKITPCLQNGKHALATDLKEGFGFGTTEFHVIRAGRTINPQHLFRVLTQQPNIEKCTRNFSGTAGQQRVQPETLKSLRILLPPLPEQRAIAAVLDSIDEAIERTEVVIAATDRLRDALLQELLTRGVPGWHTEWKEAPGIGNMPADWEVVRLGDVAEVVMGQSPPGAYSNRVGNGLPLLNGPTEFGRNYPTATQWTIDPKKRAYSGELLFCVRGATAGRMNWADREYAIGRGIASLRHHAGDEYRYFLHALVEYRLPWLLTTVTGSTFPNLSYDQISGLKMTVPLLAEQRAIADVLKGVDDAIERTRQERDGLQSLKASAADALLTGRVQYTPGQAITELEDGR